MERFQGDFAYQAQERRLRSEARQSKKRAVPYTRSRLCYVQQIPILNRKTLFFGGQRYDRETPK